MAEFGKEQALFEKDPLRRVTFRLIGNPHAGARLRLRALRQALDYLQSSHGFVIERSQVLDAGSGKGEYSFFLVNRYAGVRVTGYELEEHKVMRAQAIAGAVHTDHLRFVHGNLVELPSHNEFDLAICLDVLEHIEDDRAAMRAMYGALKPAGFLILHVPNLVPALFDIVEEGHVRDGYDNEQMRDMLTHVGFEILQIRNPTGFWGHWADSLCEVLSDRPLLRGLGIPLYATLMWLDQFGSQRQSSPQGYGILVVARKPA